MRTRLIGADITPFFSDVLQGNSADAVARGAACGSRDWFQPRMRRRAARRDADSRLNRGRLSVGAAPRRSAAVMAAKSRVPFLADRCGHSPKSTPPFMDFVFKSGEYLPSFRMASGLTDTWGLAAAGTRITMTTMTHCATSSLASSRSAASPGLPRCRCSLRAKRTRFNFRLP